MKRWVLILLSIVLLVWNSANAQTRKNTPWAKFSHSLVALHEQHAAHLTQRRSAPFKPADPLVTLADDRVLVDAISSGGVEALKSDLEALGMQEAVAFGRVVSGQLPISQLPAAAELASLRFAQPAAAITRTGTVTSQGDAAMKADVARTNFGVDGAGVKVGVLSDSFNCLSGAATDVANGDLSPVTVVQEISSCSGATDEGRAMLQIVHDVAPGSPLAFASAFNGQAAFANNIIALKDNGAKVIVDDVFYFAEPMFQDGIIAQAVDNVVAAGVSYFSAAGNEARQSYESAFRPGASLADGAIPSAAGAPHFWGGTAHNFNFSGGNDSFQSMTIPAHTSVTFSLQWNSPFFSVSGSPGSPNDLDVYLLNSAGTQVLAGSATDNNGGDALEFFSYTNNSAAPVNVNLMIVKFSGANPGLMKYVWFGSLSVNEFVTQSGTIFGHANAAGAEAVGAARYSQTPEFGVAPPVLESFSSAGGTPILFDVDGNALSDPRADKPEIVAPDGADTTFFGSDTDGNGRPNFFGTSAAAPHAAGLAALLLGADPTLAPADVYGLLENTAIDMGAPGFDNDTGFGFIQADTAVEAVLNQLTEIDVAVTQTDSPDPVIVGNNLTYTVTVTNRGVLNATGVVLTDTLPANVNFVSSVANQGSCSGSSIVICDLSDLAAHATATVTIVVSPTVVGGLSNSATVTANETDSNLANNTANQVTTVSPVSLAIGASSLSDGEVHLAYHGDLQISGGASPYTVRIGPGLLPAGLNVNSSGIISGNPTGKSGKKIKSFTVKVTDSLGSSVSKQFTIKIFGAPGIKTKKLNKGAVGKSYSTSLAGTGGKSPYSNWFLVAGSLPAGLSPLNPSTGTIAGIPTVPGTFSLTIGVTDALGGVVQKNFTLAIK